MNVNGFRMSLMLDRNGSKSTVNSAHGRCFAVDATNWFWHHDTAAGYALDLMRNVIQDLDETTAHTYHDALKEKHLGHDLTECQKKILAEIDAVTDKCRTEAMKGINVRPECEYGLRLEFLK